MPANPPSTPYMRRRLDEPSPGRLPRQQRARRARSASVGRRPCLCLPSLRPSLYIGPWVLQHCHPNQCKVAQASGWVAAWPSAAAAARVACQESVRRLETALATRGSVRWAPCRPEDRGAPAPDAPASACGSACDGPPPDRDPGLVLQSDGAGGGAGPAPADGRALHVTGREGDGCPGWDAAVRRLVAARLGGVDLRPLGLARVRIAGVTRVYNDGLAALCVPSF